MSPSAVPAHEQAFETWLDAQRRSGRISRASSAALYRAIWGSFAGWCRVQLPPLVLTDLRREHLLAFQGSRLGEHQTEISPRHALRMLRLIDQVLVHHLAMREKGTAADLGQGTVDAGILTPTAATEAIDAQPAVRYAEATSMDSLPQVLDPVDADQLIAFLLGTQKPVDSGSKPLRWQEIRNRVSIALQLGAGLGPTEVRNLQVNSVIFGGRDIEGHSTGAGRVKGYYLLQVAANGDGPAREAPLAGWATSLLTYWVDVRAKEQLGGVWFFPSTRAGKPWGKEAQYLGAKQVFTEAGLTDVEGGSFRLRHTFALRQLRRGTAAEQVARWLGVTEPKVMMRYQRLLQSMPEVV